MDNSAGKSSMTEGAPQVNGFGMSKALERMELLPQPDGPTIRPTFQSKSSIGRLPVKWSSDFSARGTSKMEANCFTRGLFTIGLETTKSTLGTVDLPVQIWSAAQTVPAHQNIPQ